MDRNPPLLRRLNGRPQACDSCRVRKVACDHGQPACSRCSKRDQVCLYTASELKTKRPRRNSTSSATPLPSIQLGYLGFTSHNTVFEETRHSLSLVHGSTLDTAALRGPSVKSRACLVELPAALREMCLFVLRNLPGENDDVLSYRFHCRADRWVIDSVKATLKSLYANFGENLANRDDVQQLEEMGLVICNNTAKPQDEHPSNQDWLDQFAFPTLRWESVGLVFTYWDGNPGASQQTVVTCLGYCIELAGHFSAANDLLLYLCYRRSTIQSLISGDASLLCWRYHADTITLLTFLGLHVKPDNFSYSPSLRSENKRRIASRIFIIDKVMVSFTGRPPLIGRRYFSTPLPLDISDEDFSTDPARLGRAVQTLSADGWNVDGRMHSSTIIRARLQIAVIKDELLEIALGNYTAVTLDALHEIKARAEGIFAGFPDSLTHRPEDLESPDLDIDIAYFRILCRLEHLQNLFFVERLMLRLGHSDQSRLLIISFEMVTLTLVFWTQQDRFADARQDFELLLMAYAAPGGGILCLELLRPTFYGSHPNFPNLSRSAIIQKLSLLVGFFDWVRPPAPNANLCADCKAIIQGVLDHNLNTPPVGGGALNVIDWDIPMQLDFNFDLLDTFDWLRPE